MKAVLPRDVHGPFVTRNAFGLFAGDLGSFIERQNYLLGGYEKELIDSFLSLLPPGRRGIAIDVGANCGIHAVAFARSFGSVHCFEPNRRVIPALRRNLALNDLHNVTVHEIGLGERREELPFYAGDKANGGLGTFSTFDQYDFELIETGRFQVDTIDNYLAPAVDGRVDAIKIDVQGFEPHVLRGSRRLLASDRPYVWLEVSGATLAEFPDLTALRAFFPYPVKVIQFALAGMIWRSERSAEVADGPLAEGNYFVIPT
jgi:FkbM family methyltransferase